MRLPAGGSLSFDEVAIRQHLEFDGKNTYGYVDMGVEEKVAKHAFVFMLIAINQQWKVPLGNFLINPLCATQKEYY